ncbi:MAG: asparagine synthase (glutamine-hydrolyzing) [Magnetococcales bacterium]|nr:asparagine synthase (glutamine-hydrolyzing) [Magnetococcales bacterium]
MCGIAGTLSFSGYPLTREKLLAMGDRLYHRGPDHAGLYLENSEGKLPGPSIGLVHRRLSIIDLSERANQPMSNETATIWLVFNGEIYNFIELRAELLNLGHEFRCDSDGETIIHGYESHGEAFFSRLNGMFALALWDSPRQTLYLARDRFGKKPLYFHYNEQRLHFASELKALIVNPDVPRMVDPKGLARYLYYEYLPSSSTILMGVSKVAPGSFVRFTRTGARETHYWTPQFCAEPTIENSSDKAVCEKLDALLHKAVARRLISDVPLGLFLSGGLDSSAILAYMRKIMPDQEISSFSVAFRERSFDESQYARQVAKHFRTHHHELTLMAGDLVHLLPDLWRIMDEPYADPSLAPTYALARFAKQNVTVIMGGDGGDEMFMGYDPFLAHGVAQWYEHLPLFLHRGIVCPLVRQMPVSLENMSLDFKAKQFILGLYQPPIVRNQFWVAAFLPADYGELMEDSTFLQKHGVDLVEETNSLLHGMECRDWGDEVTLHFLRNYLAGDILPKLDMAGMSISLEMRSPFLDPDLADFAIALPSRYKMRWFRQKYCLKRVLAHKLPPSILHRRKKGFGIPVAQWVRNELKEQFLDSSFFESLRSYGIRTDTVRRLVQEHLVGQYDHRKKLWSLFVLSQWHQHGWPTHDGIHNS